MQRRNNQPLAFSEYVSADPENSSQVWGARLLLMETVRRVYPVLLEKLRSDVLPAYSELKSTGFEFDLWNRMSPVDRLPSESPLRSALNHWASEFHIQPGWLLNEALRTLRDWDLVEEWKHELRWHAMHSFSVEGASGSTFQFSFSGWDTEAQSWRSYREAIQQRFELQLSQYEEETRRMAECVGLIRTQQKYSLKNFEWYVLYNFAGWPSPKIADQHEGKDERFSDASTILKGIKAVGELVSIPKREVTTSSTG